MAEDRVNTVTHCRYCRTELSYDKTRGCKVCFTCHPPSKTTIAPPEKKKYLDVAMTEAMVRDIVRDELENWHIQKPPVAKTEPMTATEVLAQHNEKGEVTSSIVTFSPNWRQQAKELGIPLFQRKKADVMADIEAKKAG